MHDMKVEGAWRLIFSLTGLSVASLSGNLRPTLVSRTPIPSERLDRATLNSRTRAAGALSLGCLAVSACGGAADRGAGQWGTAGARRANGFRPVQRARDR